MLFAAILLSSVGYSLIYAAVKGDGYKIDGIPVWRQPWLPAVDLFTGHSLGGPQITTTSIAVVGTGAGGGTPTPIANPGVNVY